MRKVMVSMGGDYPSLVTHQGLSEKIVGTLLNGQQVTKIVETSHRAIFFLNFRIGQQLGRGALVNDLALVEDVGAV